MRGLVWLLLAAASAAAYPQVDASRVDSAPQSSASSSPGALDSLRKWLEGSTSQSELLPPDQAFRIAVRARDANTLVAELTPARNYYLYCDRISFSVADPPTIVIASVSLSKGEAKADPTFGTVDVFHARWRPSSP